MLLNAAKCQSCYSFYRLCVIKGKSTGYNFLLITGAYKSEGELEILDLNTFFANEIYLLAEN